jgi:cell division protein FtsB
MKYLPWDKATLYRNGVFLLVLVCLALVVHEVFGQNGILALRHQRKELEAQQLKIQQLQQENEQLERQIKALRSDPKAIERLAREQMRMARPGEIIYTLPDKDSQNPPTAVAKQNPPK